MAAKDQGERPTMEKSKSSLDRGSRERCPSCKFPLPSGAVFCPKCGPPLLPDEDPEDGLTVGQTVLRIVAIVLLFALVTIFKYDLKFSDYFPQIGHQAESEAPSRPADDEDLSVVHLVNAVQANIRDNGSKSGKILFVVKKGDRVTVLREVDNWSEIRVKDGRAGWVYSALLTAKVQ